MLQFEFKERHYRIQDVASMLITTRKRSYRKVFFHKRVSVYPRQEGCVPQHVLEQGVCVSQHAPGQGECVSHHAPGQESVGKGGCEWGLWTDGGVRGEGMWIEVWTERRVCGPPPPQDNH